MEHVGPREEFGLGGACMREVTVMSLHSDLQA
jgi:hypothetical protein